jgi:hypothetical protein
VENALFRRRMEIAGHDGIGRVEPQAIFQNA